jgi:hypothetical protein
VFGVHQNAMPRARGPPAEERSTSPGFQYCLNIERWPIFLSSIGPSAHYEPYFIEMRKMFGRSA